LVLISMLGTGGCGSSTSGGDGGDGAGGSGGAAGAAGSAGHEGGGASGTGGQAGGGAGGSGGCGGLTCSSTQVCVHPSCGGAAPQCVAVPAQGCPSGWAPVTLCTYASGGSGPGCLPPPCTPPPAFCADVPAACGGTPTCACLGGTICRGNGACGFVSGDQVGCLSA
jgi:hypothetical protein